MTLVYWPDVELARREEVDYDKDTFEEANFLKLSCEKMAIDL